MTYLIGLLAHFDDATGVISDGTERRHGEHENGRGEHTHSCDSGAEEPADVSVDDAGLVSEIVTGDKGDGDADNGEGSGLEAHGHSGDDVGGGALFGLESRKVDWGTLVLGCVFVI